MAVSLQKLFIQTFEDHEGRPGLRGGSLPRGVSVTTKVEKAAPNLSGRGSFLIDSSGDIRKTSKEHETGAVELGYDNIEQFFKDGGIRLAYQKSRSGRMETILQTSSIDTPTLRHIQSMYDDDKLEIHGDVFWDNTSATSSMGMYVSSDEFLSARGVDNKGSKYVLTNEGLFAQGTGKGHHGHKGRPGHVGGSLPRTRTGISDLAKRHLKYDREEYINKVDRILDEMPLSPRLADVAGEINLDVREDMGSNYAGHFGNTIQVSRAAVEGKFDRSLGEAYRFAPTVLHGVVAHELGHHVQGRLDFEEAVEWNRLIEDRNLFSGFRKNKLPDINEEFASPLRGNELFAESFAYYMWDPSKLPSPVLDYMDSISIDVKQNQQLFIQGGPGSGFAGHKGRPGMVGGSSKSDRTLEDVLDEQDKANDEVEEEVKTLDELFKLKPKLDHRKRVEDVVNRLGYPVDQVESTEDQGYLFNVGDQQFRAGADYDPTTGKIRVFDVDARSESELEGMLAHEVQHSRWKAYHDAYQAQFIEVHKSVRDNVYDHEKWLIRADGSLKNPEDRDRFWAYDIHEEFISTQSRNWKLLEREDGVTGYSTAYWKAAKESGSAFDYDRAVDETLAEIARLETQKSLKSLPVSPLWKDLYKEVKRKRTKRNQLFLFGGEVKRA